MVQHFFYYRRKFKLLYFRLIIKLIIGYVYDLRFQKKQFSNCSFLYCYSSIMLQQILRDLYVDPEILAELDEQQKQTLFCKMREEQVRRWKMWNDNEQTETTKPTIKNYKTKKNVSFMKGTDGEPWVWVMGEHENDKTIEEILAEEAREEARKIAEKETEEIRKQVEKLSEYIDLTPKIEDLEITTTKLQIENDMDIYCSVDELRDKMKNQPKNINNYSMNHYSNKNKLNMMDAREVLQEISINTKVAQRVALWEKRLTEERTCEIFNNIQRKQMETAREAEEADKKQEQLWIEQGKAFYITNYTQQHFFSFEIYRT